MKSRGFSDVADNNQKILKTIAERYVRGDQRPKTPDYKKIADIYAACQNEAQIEESARRDFQNEIRPILKMKSKTDLPAQLAKLHLERVNVLFGFGPTQDLKNPSEEITEADQGGMGLPTNEYYLSDAGEMSALRETYRVFAKAALLHAGFKDADAEQKSKTILKLETDLAKASMGPVERRDPEKMYHRLERDGLMKLAKSFGWDAYFAALGLPKIKTINVAAPGFFSSLDETMAKYSIDDFKAYMITRLFAQSASAMDKGAIDDYFKLVSKMYGLQQIPPRTKRCLDELEDDVGFALAHAFVSETFSAKSKASVADMVSSLQAEMRKRIQTADWMDEATRSEALKKLDKQAVMVGYPDKWRSYETLKTTRTSMLKNRLAAREFASRYQLAKIGKPYDRTEWQIVPSVVNAINTISQNVIFFPAGILQPPNYDEAESDAANFGSMGTIMGHEITHAYDDQGRLFDERGALRSWWSETTNQKFKERAKCVTDQFDTYQVTKSLHVNGKLVMGEAIADLGGMKMALDALHTKLKDAASPAQDKIFFTSLAQAWCSKTTDAFETYQTNSDNHPIYRFRVNGLIRNMPEFAKAFSCKTGQALAPAKRCEVW